MLFIISIATFIGMISYLHTFLLDVFSELQNVPLQDASMYNSMNWNTIMFSSIVMSPIIEFFAPTHEIQK